MIDIDHFKVINDTYGHQAGDIALVTIVNRIRELLRMSDSMGRYGGEEFLVILAQTDISHAIEIAERIRHDGFV